MNPPVTCSFTYLPEGFTLECVKYGDGTVRFNLMPEPFPPPGPVTAPSSPADPMPDPAPVVSTSVEPLEAVSDTPVPEDVVCAAAPPPRLAPAASSGFKAGLASFGGMLAAGLLYVQENFGSVADISLKNVILIAAGAVISGLLYFFYRWYKPHTP